MTSTREIRKKSAPVADSAGRLRRPAGGRDIIYLCDMIDELEGIVRDVQGNLPLTTQYWINQRLLIVGAKINP